MGDMHRNLKWDLKSSTTSDLVLIEPREKPSWPRPMMGLFPFLIETIGVLFGGGGRVLRALVSIHQLALSLLGGMVANLWKSKPIEHPWHNTSLESNHQAFNTLHQSFQGKNRGLAPKSATTILLSFDIWNLIIMGTKISDFPPT